MSWDDLSYVLALSRAGSLGEAARALGVAHTTVSRRINALEEAHGVKLFEKTPSGFVPTHAGQELATAAESVEERVLDAERRLAGHVEDVSGDVNVASMAALAPTPSMTYYNAGKAGLAAASEALRGELRGSGVNVLTVYPGIIAETEMTQAGLLKYESTPMLRLQPTATAAELARSVVHALRRRRARVILPRFNRLARMFPGFTRWVLDRFAPKLAPNQLARAVKPPQDAAACLTGLSPH